MSDAYGESDVVFGKESLPDWREQETQDDPDDEELEETPMDVVTILGFDPKKE
jgi:hypothetical protein